MRHAELPARPSHPLDVRAFPHPRNEPVMTLARIVYRPLAWLFVTAIALQFLLAVLAGGSIVPHRGLGMLLMLAGLLLLVLALLARLGARVIGACVSLLVLLVLQAVFVRADLTPAWLRSLHVLDALFIAALGSFLALAAVRPKH